MKSSTNPRRFRGTSFYKLVIALCLLAATLPYQLMRTTEPVGEGLLIDCRHFSSRAACHQRKAEWLAQASLEKTVLRPPAIKTARLRAQTNARLRKTPQGWQKNFIEGFAEVQKLLSDHDPHSSIPPAFPDVSIVGFPKAGTSQLYKLLVEHPEIGPVYSRKEFCINHKHFLDYTQHPDQVQDLVPQLQKYQNQVARKRQKEQNKLLVNACLQPIELDYHFAYMMLQKPPSPPPRPKFIVLFRDPADWLWASWNYWVDAKLDAHPPQDHDWASPGHQYRSPELFHELIVSGDLLQVAARRFGKIRAMAVDVPRRLQWQVRKLYEWTGVPLKENPPIHFVKMEDMKYHSENPKSHTQFLTTLASFLNISPQNFNQTIARGQTNCNAQKGYQQLCQDSPNTYAITHHRPMLETTREWIYMQFWEECKVWSEEFGIVYPECLRSVPRQQR